MCGCAMCTVQADEVVAVHTSTGTIISRRTEKGNRINTLQLRPGDGGALATAGSDMAVRVYDEPSGQLAAELRQGDDMLTTGHSNAVYSLAWVPDQPQVRGGTNGSRKGGISGTHRLLNPCKRPEGRQACIPCVG